MPLVLRAIQEALERGEELVAAVLVVDKVARVVGDHVSPASDELEVTKIIQDTMSTMLYFLYYTMLLRISGRSSFGLF